MTNWKEKAAKLEKALLALVEESKNGRFISRVGLAWDVTEEVAEALLLAEAAR